jgi:predicted glycosyltransferase
MRILIEITHPADVHLFREAVKELKVLEHTIAIAARDKDMTLGLLRAYGLDHKCLSRQGKGLMGLGFELLVRDWHLWRLAREFNPDLLIARVGTCAAHVGVLIRRPVLILDDTEHASLQQRLGFRFASRVCTSQHYEKNWGRKHVRYRSIGELAYLHPDHFRPDSSVMARLGLSNGEIFSLVRFVSWKAAHDFGNQGTSWDRRMWILERLRQHGRVFVSSEHPLPEEFRQYQLPVELHEFHDVLAHARLCFSEGATVAAEAAILGIPSVYVNSHRIGRLQYLERKYQLARNITDLELAVPAAERLLCDPASPMEWQKRRARLLAEEEDMVKWLVSEIESFGD